MLGTPVLTVKTCLPLCPPRTGRSVESRTTSSSSLGFHLGLRTPTGWGPGPFVKEKGTRQSAVVEDGPHPCIRTPRFYSGVRNKTFVLRDPFLKTNSQTQCHRDVVSWWGGTGVQTTCDEFLSRRKRMSGTNHPKGMYKHLFISTLYTHEE